MFILPNLITLCMYLLVSPVELILDPVTDNKGDRKTEGRVYDWYQMPHSPS